MPNIFIGDKNPTSMYLGTLNVGSIILGDGTPIWPQASPQASPSVTPSITPSVSVSPSVTPSITPSKTPSTTYYYNVTRYTCYQQACDTTFVTTARSSTPLTIGRYYYDGNATWVFYISSTHTSGTWNLDDFIYSSTSCDMGCNMV